MHKKLGEGLCRKLTRKHDERQTSHQEIRMQTQFPIYVGVLLRALPARLGG